MGNTGREGAPGAEDAAAEGWGDPPTWLHQAHAFFARTTPDLARLPVSAAPERLTAAPPRPRCGAARARCRGITLRETDVLVLLARGLSNREIAARLRLSPRTVEKHVERLMGKTETTRRTQLVALMTSLTGPHRRR